MERGSGNNQHSTIGIFDSGIGGLSICKEINKVLPDKSFIYLADSLNAPYGEKSTDNIVSLSIKNTEFLLERGCEIIVVACNTATTNSISILRNRYKVPFIGIEPAIKPAALKSLSGKVGVLATAGTLSSELFLSTSSAFRKKLQIIEVEGKGLVKLIEENRLNETKPLLENYLGQMIDQGVDNIVLGCTHYPFLVPIIQKLIPGHVKIIDSGEAVARQTKTVILKSNIQPSSGSPRFHFYTNGDNNVLNTFVNKIGIESAEVIATNF